MGQCYECKYFILTKWITEKYDQGFGLCELEGGQIRFCTHECRFCTKGKYNEN